MIHPDDDLLTSEDVAERIGKSRATVTRFVREGRLVPAWKAPGSRGLYLFDPSEVDRYLSEVLTPAERHRLQARQRRAAHRDAS